MSKRHLDSFEIMSSEGLKRLIAVDTFSAGDSQYNFEMRIF